MTAWRFSVVCGGSIPARGEIAIRRLGAPSLHGVPVAGLLGFRARGPIRFRLPSCGGGIAPFWHGF